MAGTIILHWIVKKDFPEEVIFEQEHERGDESGCELCV